MKLLSCWLRGCPLKAETETDSPLEQAGFELPPQEVKGSPPR